MTEMNNLKNIREEALKMHLEKRGKISIKSKVKVNNQLDLSLAYTPGVAEPCKEIAKDRKKVYHYTSRWNTVAVVSDGSAVLGLGNIGPEAAMPVMEGKAILFKAFANIDAWPICLATQDTEKIIETVKNLAPSFGGINLEDISAPRCFEIEKRLQDIGIPVFHDDQYGTAIVVLAALINATKVVRKNFEDLIVVIFGAGASGMKIAEFLLLENKTKKSVKNVIMIDSRGIIHKGRTDLTKEKQEIAQRTNKENIRGSLADAIKGADVFIGVSTAANVLTKEMIRTMNKDAIIFAMSNPDPEIHPQDAWDAGAAVVGTGRSDYPNQINNVLGFPGIFRGALDAGATKINLEMKLAAASALANAVSNPTKDKILPLPFEKEVHKAVARAVKRAARQSGVIRA